MLIKICGIKNLDTLKCCEENKIDFFGMIFYSKSARNIDIKNAEILQRSASKLNIKGVGVFVDEMIENLIDIIKKLNLNYVQLHGEEDNDYVRNLKNLKVKVIKKISIKDESDLNKIKFYKNADYLLFDYQPNKYELPGGNSKKFDWNIVKDLIIDQPWFVSGGINVNNIKLLKSKIDPFGIDLSSGVEKDLGIKDNQIINNFMSELRNA